MCHRRCHRALYTRLQAGVVESGTAGLLLWLLPGARCKRSQRPASGPAESISLPTMTSFRPGAGWGETGSLPSDFGPVPSAQGRHRLCGDAQGRLFGEGALARISRSAGVGRRRGRWRAVGTVRVRQREVGLCEPPSCPHLYQGLGPPRAPTPSPPPPQTWPSLSPPRTHLLL